MTSNNATTLKRYLRNIGTARHWKRVHLSRRPVANPFGSHNATRFNTDCFSSDFSWIFAVPTIAPLDYFAVNEAQPFGRMDRKCDSKTFSDGVVYSPIRDVSVSDVNGKYEDARKRHVRACLSQCFRASTRARALASQRGELDREPTTALRCRTYGPRGGRPVALVGRNRKKEV